MPALDDACRLYQRLFDHGHPEEAALVELHRKDRSGEYLTAYFAHEYAKGGRVVERFEGLAPGSLSGRVLDFGAGAGGLTYRIREKASSAVGIDLDAEKLAFARKQAARLETDNIEFVCYDGGKTPFADGEFDAVVCVDVVEHLPNPAEFLKEFRRILKPGGHLLVSFGPPWGHAHGKHMWAKLPGWWTHLLFPRRVVMRTCGFDENTTYEDLGLHRLTVGKYERAMARSGFVPLHEELVVNRAARWAKRVPFVRELVIGEVVGVYRNP